MVRECYLKGHGICGGRISREHYFSETVLQAISSDGKVQIAGLPWQPKETLQNFGISSLVSKVLCETHNSRLSALDSAAGEFFRAVNAADKSPKSLPDITTVDGTVVERWFLKVLCGLAAGMGFNNGNVPDEWCEALIGKQWPDHWGLYVPTPAGSQVLAKEFSIDPLTYGDKKEVKGAKFRVAGVHFTIFLDRPHHPIAWGIYRPRGLIFQQERCEKRIEFKWPSTTNKAVIYTKIGSSKSRPPQWDGWKE